MIFNKSLDAYTKELLKFYQNKDFSKAQDLANLMIKKFPKNNLSWQILSFIYLEQEKIMSIYKNKFQSKIYNLNYDLLVSNPDKEIKSLISWLGWNWQDLYLSPHQNTRAIATRSSVEVRSPINSKSIGGWQNYKELLKPAMEILIQNKKYKNLKY